MPSIVFLFNEMKTNFESSIVCAKHLQLIKLFHSMTDIEKYDGTTTSMQINFS